MVVFVGGRLCRRTEVLQAIGLKLMPLFIDVAVVMRSLNGVMSEITEEDQKCSC